MPSFSLKKTFASLPRTTRGQFIVINGDPNGENFLYCNGNQIFIRNIRDSSICDIYTEHIRETTVAKYSPSSFYIASGDKSGKVRVWDTVNPEHILKKEHPVIAGPIKDIDWTYDSSRICAVGEGRETFGRVFSYDSGNNVGFVTGHTKSINNCSLKPNKLLKLATCSEDHSTVFLEGPPFQYKCTTNNHDTFVNAVRYSPSGEIFVTGGSNGKLFIYDGKTSETLAELGKPKAHKGGIYSICFNKDGTKLLTVSGDKTAKIWDMDSKQVEKEFVLGNQVTDMQVACLWQDDILLTVSLSGHINYLDVDNPSQPKKIIKGHSKPIVSMSVSDDCSKIYTGSSDGLIVCWNSTNGDAEEFKGKGHTNQINGMAMDGDYLVTASMDDTVRFTSTTTMEYGDCLKLDSQPKDVDFRNGIAVVASLNHITVVQAPGRTLGRILSTMPITFEAFSISIHPNGTQVAVGTKSSIIIYDLSNGTLTESRKLAVSSEVTVLQYSHDGAWLAAGFHKVINAYNISTWEEKFGGWGEQHTASVTSIKWSPDSQRFVTGSVDSHMILWDLVNINTRKPSVRAHPMSIVNQVDWLDNNTVVTAGQDSNVKLWAVTD